MGPEGSRQESEVLFNDDAVRANFERDLAEQGVVVEAPRSFPEPDIDYTVFGAREKDIQEDVSILESWLRLPYVTDSFGTDPADHLKRREWRRAMQEKYGDSLAKEKTMYEVFHANKFSANSLMQVGYTSEILRVLANEPAYADLLERIKNAHALELVESYDAAEPLDERRAKIMAMEDAVVEVLNALAEFSHHGASEESDQAEEPFVPNLDAEVLEKVPRIRELAEALRHDSRYREAFSAEEDLESDDLVKELRDGIDGEDLSCILRVGEVLNLLYKRVPATGQNDCLLPLIRVEAAERHVSPGQLVNDIRTGTISFRELLPPEIINDMNHANSDIYTYTSGLYGEYQSLLIRSAAD